MTSFFSNYDGKFNFPIELLEEQNSSGEYFGSKLTEFIVRRPKILEIGHRILKPDSSTVRFLVIISRPFLQINEPKLYEIYINDAS